MDTLVFTHYPSEDTYRATLVNSKHINRIQYIKVKKVYNNAHCRNDQLVFLSDAESILPIEGRLTLSLFPNIDLPKLLIVFDELNRHLDSAKGGGVRLHIKSLKIDKRTMMQEEDIAGLLQC